MALLMFLHYLHYCSCLVYCQIFLEDEILVVPTTICGMITCFFGGSKGVPSEILSYHVSVLSPPGSSLSPPYCMDLMEY